MINEKNLRKLKRLVYGLIVVFILFFLIGFLDLNGETLLVLMLLYFALGIALNDLIFKSKVEGKLKMFLLIAGNSSVVFSLGEVYGITGIWGVYSINDPIYLGSVIISCIGFITGIIGSLVLFNNNRTQNAESANG